MKATKIILMCFGIIFIPLANAAVISLEAGGTFLLRHSSDITGNTTDAVSIDLVALGFSGGDTIFLESLGDFDKGPGGDTLTDWTLGVFSSSNTLLAATVSHRVPDAIDAGVDHVSGNTWNWNTNSTTSDSQDIAEDFRIFGEGLNGLTIAIPLGAQFLFVGNLDNGTRDNVDPDNDYALRISAVPVPAAVWLFGSALGLLGWMRRKTA